MKRILAFAAVLLTLGGCYGAPGPSAGPSRHAAPITAQIIPASPGIGMRFHVNRPAYAALFQIMPGAGVSQVYPALGTGNTDGRVYSGFTSLSTLRLANVEQYAPAPLIGGGPRFYFLITSDRPLDIERFGTFGYGIRRELGLQFTDFNAFETMERIAELTIPSLVEEQSWATDFYVDWPNVLYRQPVAGLRLVPLRCGSYQMWVPLDRLMEADARICHPAQADAPQPPRPDSSGVSKPAPRAPTPPTTTPKTPKSPDQRSAAASIREQIMESAQLEASAADRDGVVRDRPGWQRVTEARGRVRSGTSGDGRASGRDVSARGSYPRAETGTTTVTSSTAPGTPTGSSGTPSASPSPSPAPSTPSAPAPSPSVLPDSNGG